MARRLIALLEKEYSKRQRQEQTGGHEAVPKEETPAETDPSAGEGGQQKGGRQLTSKEIGQMITFGADGYGDLSRLITTEMNQLSRQLPETLRVDLPELPAVGRRPHGVRLDEVEALSASSRMRARMFGLLQSIQHPPQGYGCSGRKLADRRLQGFALGNPRLFKKRIPVVQVNTAVIILLDLSGSMTVESVPGLSRCRVANQAAFSLHHTLYGLAGVKVASIEFSSRDDGHPEVNLLTDFSEKPHSAAFNQQPDGGTPTHSALWYARAALLQRPEPRKIILLLTDGQPCEADKTSAATRRCGKDHIEIVAIGIQTDSVKNFWDHHRVIHTLQELPLALFGAMEELLVDRVR